MNPELSHQFVLCWQLNITPGLMVWSAWPTHPYPCAAKTMWLAACCLGLAAADTFFPIVFIQHQNHCSGISKPLNNIHYITCINRASYTHPLLFLEAGDSGSAHTGAKFFQYPNLCSLAHCTLLLVDPEIVRFWRRHHHKTIYFTPYYVFHLSVLITWPYCNVLLLCKWVKQNQTLRPSSSISQNMSFLSRPRSAL